MRQNLETLKAILILQLGCKGSDITPDSKLCDDLGVDSLDMIEIMMEFEETFEIDTDETFWQNKELTVQDLLDLI
ncbi:MAG: acyl carrier protein [Cetobacterium sp.]|uniref:acyl carrier protein n=1 Tax=Cetobacterium sp. TaxID=2071632 RepID=UPI003F3FF4D2